MTKEKYKEELNSVLEKVLTPSPDLGKKQYNNIVKTTPQAQQSYKDYYSATISQCDTNIDAFCNIKNYYLDGFEVVGSMDHTKQQIRVRDARDANNKKPEESTDSWIQGMAAQARAISILLENVYTTTKSKNQIEDEVYYLFKSHSNLLMNDNALSSKERKDVVDNFSYDIASLLKEDQEIMVDGTKISNSNVKTIGKIINNVRDFGNFEEKSHHTMTITPKIDDKGINIVWFSRQMNPISKDLKDEYDNLIGKTWLQKLTPLQRNLVTKYKDKIISGNHIIPTQLRYLPGLKNCYMDLYGTVQENKVKEIHIAPHSGTMVQDGGNTVSDEVDRITEMQINHANNLVQQMGATKMHLQVLNSTGPGSRVLDNSDRNLCFTMDRVVKKINSHQKVIDYERAGVNSFAESDPLKNVNNITEKAKDIDKTPNTLFWAKCKSGKDRTFMILFNNMTSILGDNYKGDKEKRAIADALLYSNHAETMASSAGGSRGAVGLKLGGTYLRLFWTDRLKLINSKGNNHALGNKTGKHWENKISYINTVHPIQNKEISKRSQYHRQYHRIETDNEQYNTQNNSHQPHSYRNNNITNDDQNPLYSQAPREGPDGSNQKSNNSKNWVIAAGVVMGLIAGGPVGAVIGGGLAYSLTKDTNVGVGPVLAVGVATIVAGAFIGPAALVIPAMAFGVAKYAAHQSRKKQESYNSMPKRGYKSQDREKSTQQNHPPIPDISPPNTPNTPNTIRREQNKR